MSTRGLIEEKEVFRFLGFWVLGFRAGLYGDHLQIIPGLDMGYSSVWDMSPAMEDQVDQTFEHGMETAAGYYIAILWGPRTLP